MSTDTPACPVEYTLDLLGGTWTLLVLRDLLRFSPIRFGELRRSLGGISARTLTDRLRHLEAEGIVTRTVYAEVPVRVEYALTPRGESLAPVLTAMAAWGRQDRAAHGAPDGT